MGRTSQRNSPGDAVELEVLAILVGASVGAGRSVDAAAVVGADVAAGADVVVVVADAPGPSAATVDGSADGEEPPHPAMDTTSAAHVAERRVRHRAELLTTERYPKESPSSGGVATKPSGAANRVSPFASEPRKERSQPQRISGSRPSASICHSNAGR